MEKKYLLRTLSAAAAAERCLSEDGGKARDKLYTVELGNGSGSGTFGRYQELVVSEEYHAGCPFFHQAEKTVRELCGGDEAPDEERSLILSGYVMFLDCRYIPFSAHDEPGDGGDIAEHRKEMLSVFKKIAEKGIMIRFDGEDEPRLFKLSDRSASMSRNAKITMIRADAAGGGVSLYDALEESLMLGMDLSGIQVSLSKYYAYRGLYLSDSTRMDTVFGGGAGDGLLLNEETVIVIPDDISAEKNMVVITSSPQTGGGDLWGAPEKLTLDRDDDRARINRFDGEGLICEEYSDIINTQLGEKRYAGDDGKERDVISSYQIRLPMGKGMLHRADLPLMLKDMLALSLYRKEMSGLSADQEKNVEARYLELEVKDQFKIRRKLSKAKIVLTASMFKASKWLGEYCKQNKIADPMRFYFSRMEKYGHSLYIANDSSMMRGEGYVKLNYQFLNTLKLDEETVLSLFSKHRERVERTLSFDDSDDGIDKTGVPEESSDAERDSGEQFMLPETNKFRQIAAKDKRFLRETRVAQILSRNRRGMLYDGARGRLLVRGECRFLSRDLLSLGVHIAALANKALKPDGPFDTEELTKLCLPYDTVYMPSHPPSEYDGENGLYRAMLRSPHLSRNEQCYVKLLHNGGEHRECYSRYERYFSGLKSVVMVNYASLVPIALAGADFDGDLVKIISDNDIVRSVRKGIGAYDTGKRITRRLPVILIPSLKQPSRTIGRSVDFDVLKGSFASRVGIISNKAIILGKKEYGGKDNDGRFRGKCAESTILVGLEIDSVKTGRKPDLSRYMEFLSEQGLDMKSGRDPFLDKMEALSSIYSAVGTRFRAGRDGDGNDYLAVRAYGNGSSVTFREKKYADGAPALDMLPWLYLSECRQQAENAETDGAVTVGIRELLKKTPPAGVRLSGGEALPGSFADIVKAYCKVISKASEDNIKDIRFRSAGYSSRIMTILKQQYDGLYSPFRKDRPQDGTVYDKAAEAYAFVGGCFSGRRSAARCLNRMIAENWQYTPKARRAEKLGDLLNLREGAVPEDIARLLCRFDCSGYRLLYYMVKNIYIFDNGACVKKQRPGNGGEDRVASGNGYRSSYSAVYEEARLRRQPKSVWGKELCDKCREDIALAVRAHCAGEIEDGAAMDTALWLYAGLPVSADTSERFLWDVFSVSEIQRCTVPEKAPAQIERNIENA